MISVVATVLNEGASIRQLLESLGAQTRPADEIVIVDGGSHDATLTILNAYTAQLPLRVISAPGANISAGRNRAIREARGDLIAVTDAGVRLPVDWLEQITAPLIDQPDVVVAAGFFRAAPHTIFEAALGATTLPLADEIDGRAFLPSSRSVAFRRSAWANVGGYPEWLDYCEDLIFDLRLRQLSADAGAFAFVPSAAVDFRPRPSLRAFFTQYYRYARGDGKADLWRRRHAIRYLTYGAALPLIGLLGWRVQRTLWLLYGIGAAVYLRGPYRRLPTALAAAEHAGHVRRSPLTDVYAAALIPLIRVTGDLAKMIGYPVGWVWRLRHRPPDWRQIDPPGSAAD
ncbi:MAG: glycosyltransferase [Chloroflexi bacterium]|nr:glycosyltransferase [Chloroflexota bacterium]